MCIDASRFLALAGVGSLRILEVYCSWLGEALRKVSLLPQIERIVLGLDTGYYELPVLPRRPMRLTALHIKGWKYLRNVDTMAKWSGLSEIRFTDCPRLTDIGGVGAVTSVAALILERVGDVDLTPLRSLPGLRRLRIMGSGEVSLVPLSGMPDLTIEVGHRIVVRGETGLGPGSTVIAGD